MDIVWRRMSGQACVAEEGAVAKAMSMPHLSSDALLVVVDGQWRNNGSKTLASRISIRASFTFAPFLRRLYLAVYRAATRLASRRQIFASRRAKNKNNLA